MSPIHRRHAHLTHDTVQDAVIAALADYDDSSARYAPCGDVDLRTLLADVRAIVASIAARAVPDEAEQEGAA